MIDSIKETYKFYRDRAFLIKHGCETWKEYNRKFDPDFNPKADRIEDYYHGYPYVYCFKDHKHDIYYWDVAINGIYVVHDWCEQHIKDKFRFDSIRVHKQTPIGIDGKAGKSEFWMNGIGGRDYIFAAFKNERDYVNFLLRWS